MPVHNTGKFVGQAVKSILNQSFGEFEFVILDDGSTDHSLKALMTFAKRDKRIRLISRGGKGLVETRNELLHMARGELVAWADSDDLYAPQRLERQLRRFENEPELVVCGTRWQLIDSSNLPIKSLSFPEKHEEIVRMMLELDNAIWFPTVMMKRNVALQAGGFRHPFVIAEDYDLHLRMMEHGRVANLPDLLCYYRQHFTSTVNSRHWQAPTYSRLARTLAHERRERGTDRLQRGEVVRLEFDRPMTRSASAEHLRLKWGWWALMDGHLKTARRLAIRNAAEKPHKLESWRLLYCALRGF